MFNTQIDKYQKTWLYWNSLWLLLVLIPLFSRTFLQIDETRYVTVAWEMWIGGEWLVPSLNGELYHHKPPLLFWLMHLGWAVFGVNEWWPRIIPGLFSLGSLWLTALLARQLWPQQPQIAQWAPLILLSSLLWSLFTSATMFDMVLAFFTLLGMVAIVHAGHKNELKAYGLLGVAIGLGILTKGPVILLHLLPVALFAPWWQRARQFSWRSWYLGLLGSTLLGALIALAWAIPAGLAGGSEFRQALFWGQTANRIVNSFAHNHPLWWYLPLLPVALFPWLLWLPFWRGLLQLPQHLNDREEGVRFCFLWLILALIAFSLISGKQLHYLLPTLPAFALLMTYLIVKLPIEKQQRRWDTLLPALVIMMMGILLIMAPHLYPKLRVPIWVSQISALPGIILIILSGILITWKISQVKLRLLLISVIGILFSLILPLTIIRAAGPAYDLHEISQHISTLQRRGEKFAHFGDYHGQYQFLGRLKKPLTVVDEYTICPWLAQHPQGQLIVYFSSSYKKLSQYANYVQAYRSKVVGIIDAQFLYGACIIVNARNPIK
ncbi:MAG: glycosyltransferase family 39 protein [Gammaproteobacteria bacterium]|nr:MAG: glycosyltransferase family 39 protein [Gammaproteobacteria bacterium]RKZ44417.1 MAG: glycosyltransferase family 39 protein [Gammaproteobacteria bacterium]RKZ74645.1 MAG: glycosyltransferase family 39 protein [Gammaproteobacteria bacterium]